MPAVFAVALTLVAGFYFLHGAELTAPDAMRAATAHR